ncbi:hypothetical protein B0H14DRAFT_3501152 [Mycena olivaceomarginata]|nr:hypothetical protein B0H14DRAFT_3501152 [Mycena olivaceomarginata]
MLWLLGDRKTRRGTVFASFTNTLFDVRPLLAEAAVHEADDQEDHEEGDDCDEIDQNSPLDSLLDIDRDPPPDPFNEVDDESPPPPLLLRPPPSPPPPPPAKRRRATTFDDFDGHKPQTGSHHCRALKRKEKIVMEGRVPRASIAQEHVQSAIPIPTKLNAATLPTAHGTYAGKIEDKKTEKCGRTVPRSLTELIARGFQLIKWNGYDAYPLVDVHGRIFAVLAGQPRKQEYHASVRAAYDIITAQGIVAGFPADGNIGCSFPSWIDNKQYDPIAQCLLADPHINRMANFASSAFLPAFCSTFTDLILEQGRSLPGRRAFTNTTTSTTENYTRSIPELRRPFVGSIFSCAAFNFGPNVWTFKHRDVLNLAFGWCAIQALGDFDPTKGGHLVLWDLMLVIEFPPGALILIPSATLSHANIPVQVGDTRVSFTQFTAGGLFRYVDNGYRTEGELADADPAEYARLMEKKQSRWEQGLQMYSTVDELVKTE